MTSILNELAQAAREHLPAHQLRHVQIVAGEPDALESGCDLCIAITAGRWPFAQLLGDRLAGEERLGILGQEGLRRCESVGATAALGLPDPGDEREHGRLAAAVAADEGARLSLRDGEVEATEHPLPIAAVSEPHVIEGDCAGSIFAHGPLHDLGAGSHELAEPHALGASTRDAPCLRRVVPVDAGLVRRHDHRHAELAVRAEE